ncbi:Integrase [Gulosibacter sp. 10]|nr:Integrase [Gulosibacter sp. 10]
MDSLERNLLKQRVAFGELSADVLRLDEGPQARTVAQCIADWMATKTDLSDERRSGYEAKIRNYLLPAFGAKPVRLLDGEELKDYFLTTLPNIRKPNGEPYLKSTARRQVCFILHATLEQAVKHRHLNVNPLDVVDAPKRDKRTKKQERTLNRAAQWVPQHLLELIQGQEDEARWMFAFYGRRQSEVLGLTDECIVPRARAGEPGKVVIQQQLLHRSAKYGYGEYDSRARRWACGRQADRCPEKIGRGEFYFKDVLKTEDGDREVPLVEPFYTAVMEHIERQRAFRESEAFVPLDGDERFGRLLFTSRHGTPKRHQNDRAAWHKLLDDAEVPTALRLHDARHLAATMLFEMGVQPEKIMLIMGWSPQTLQEMLKNYAHPSSDILRVDMEAYGRRIMPGRGRSS